MAHLLSQFLNRQTRSGFTLLEFIMVGLILVLFVVFAYQKIQTSLRQGKLTKEREWVKGASKAVENYHADMGQYPTSLSDLTSTTPPYLSEALASKCGSLMVSGGVRTFHSCNVDTLQFHYLFRYTQWDMNASRKSPPIVADYSEQRTRIPWNSGPCGVIPANTRYFYETFEGKLTMSGCGLTEADL